MRVATLGITVRLLEDEGGKTKVDVDARVEVEDGVPPILALNAAIGGLKATITRLEGSVTELEAEEAALRSGKGGVDIKDVAGPGAQLSE